jgi:PAS domain S-box-containing protein
MSDRVESERTDSRAAVFERVTDAVVALDSDCRFTYLDDRAARLFEVEAEEVLGCTAWEALPALADSPFREHCLRALSTGSPTEFEQQPPGSDDRFTVRLYPSADGVTACLRPTADTADEEPTEQRHERVIESLTDACVTVDDDGIIRHANASVQTVFGYEPAELLGEPITTLIPPRFEERHNAGFERYLETGERQVDWRDMELSGLRKDGEEVPLSISFTVHEEDGEKRLTGLIRDISERKQREWALRETNRTISDADLTFEQQVERLLEVGCAVVGTEYGTLSEVRGDDYVFDIVEGPADAVIESGDTVALETTNCERVIETEETLALADVSDGPPELAGRAGNEEMGIACYLGAPVVVDGDLRGTFCFYDTEPRSEEFSDWQVTLVEYLGEWVSQELERQRYVDRLDALNEINEVVREVTDAVLNESTRGEIEQRVCEALAATDSYLFAWIGEPNPQTQAVDLRAEAGVENYLDSNTITVDPADAESQGPTGRAIRTGEVQALQRVGTVESYEQWQDTADAYGFTSSAAIPIGHEGTNYGVLNLYTDRPDAFEGREYAVVDLLGKIVGHAIAAAARKQALLSDSMVEVEIRCAGVLDQIDLSERPAGQVTLEAATPREGGEYVVFGTAERGDEPFIEALTSSHPDWEEVLSVEQQGEELSFEVLMVEPPVLTTLASVGGHLVEVIIEEGDLWIRMQLPHGADVRQTLDAVREAYPSTSLVSKQEVSSERTADHWGQALPLDELTDRQLEALRTAYHAGYFAWPREASGEDVAEMLDISAPTLSQHLRGAERMVFTSLFEEDGR